mgnify:CR=1 FL=1
MAATAWGMGSTGVNAMTMAAGVDGFFQPNPLAFWSARMALGPESAGYYSTAPLAKTLTDLIDPD